MQQYSIGFNILSAHSELEKNLLASDLVAVFQRLSTTWGDQMNSVLQNAILAFLESDRRGTIADLRRFLIEPAFRNEFLKSVKDSEVVYYWQKSFPAPVRQQVHRLDFDEARHVPCPKAHPSHGIAAGEPAGLRAYHGQRQNLSGEIAGGIVWAGKTHICLAL